MAHRTCAGEEDGPNGQSFATWGRDFVGSKLIPEFYGYLAHTRTGEARIDEKGANYLLDAQVLTGRNHKAI